MKQNCKTSVALCEDEVAILDATARRLGISRSEVMRHLILYSGMVGGDFPLTSRILALPHKDRERVIGEIRTRAEAGNPAKPQSFRQWVKDTVGKADEAAVEKTGEALLKELLEMAK
ncbi:ribbon-helix-helix protein, CopG family [Luteolibacter sp. SL250]|uniref:ribbon-helix-helix protein, CopG family n=1 Tax=Luteolibacter sp. SL250 TaxID=2995170 RepID=UPI00226FA38D|nr:ribbon-helix-helix protein, CopG family [Luteolibacter sp. SL250]WAC18803.1 ribbon-helix-helix protein, CopG family [Luteolibacter sp. SL250]